MYSSKFVCLPIDTNFSKSLHFLAQNRYLDSQRDSRKWSSARGINLESHGSLFFGGPGGYLDISPAMCNSALRGLRYITIDPPCFAGNTGQTNGQSTTENGSNNGNMLNSFSKTSVLFVSVSFIILMVISLAWLVFYYVQRFRYAHAKDRLAVRQVDVNTLRLCTVSYFVFMKFQKNATWFRRRRAVGFDRAFGAIESNCFYRRRNHLDLFGRFSWWTRLCGHFDGLMYSRIDSSPFCEVFAGRIWQGVPSCT